MEKKILFDLTKTQSLNGTKFHGGAKYGIAVFKKLVEQSPSSIAAFFDPSRYIDPSIIELCHKHCIPMEQKSQMTVVSAAKKFGGILYSPLNDSSYLKDESIQVIVTIHGMRILEMPYDEYETVYSKKSLKKRFLEKIFLYKILLKKERERDFEKNLKKNRLMFSNKRMSFVTVSNHSKYSLLSFFPQLKDDDIKVFYSPSTIDDSIFMKDYKNPYGKYFLLVSGNRWLKNAARAMLALDELFSEHADFEGKVVVTGVEKLSDIKVNIKNIDRFIFVGYVDEKLLKNLYRHAYLFIYPSLNEGFGYPPLEAMHEGCPVISAAIAAIPEICGDAVMYFNPYSIPEIKMRVLQMENSDVRTDYIRRGYERQKMIQNKEDLDLIYLTDYILSFLK